MRLYREGAVWYIDWRDLAGKRRRWPGFPQKTLTESYGRKLDELVNTVRAKGPPSPALLEWLGGLKPRQRAKLRNMGLVVEAVASGGIEEHVTEWEAALRRRERTASHIKAHVGRVRLAVKRMGVASLSEITADAVEKLLGGLRTPETKEQWARSAATANQYLVALRAFVRWCIETGRMSADPLTAVERIPVVTKAKVRHPLPEADCVKLLANLDHARYWLYRLALETGMRWGELVSLTPASFRWGKQPSVTVQAAYSRKGKRDRTVPLRTDTAKELRTWLGDRPHLFENLPNPEHAAQVFRADLQAAGVPNADRYDFHCLRHTFLTRLASAGTPLPILMALSGHATASVALGYIHVNEAEKRAAVTAAAAVKPSEET